MIRRLIEWSVGNPLLVILLAVALAAFGSYAFLNVNVEAYPDPAPAIIEVIAQYPGASAQEVERQVTVPLEVTLAGMPGLKYTRSKSLFGLAYLNNQFQYGVDFKRARQEVINRLSFAQLPQGIVPQISPRSPLGEFYRYIVRAPNDALGRDIYTLNDIKAMQDWTLEREFLRLPRIAGVTSFGGTVKRYEINPDPDRMKRYGVALQQLQDAITSSNANTGGAYLNQGRLAHAVRGIGLIGAGRDPMQEVWTVAGGNDEKSASAASDYLRRQEDKRVRAIRQVVVLSVNNIPIRIDDVVEGGHVPEDMSSHQGVMVGSQTRLGKVSFTCRKKDQDGRQVFDDQGQPVWIDRDEAVQGVVLLRKGEESLPALKDVKAKVQALNDDPGRLLPGVKLEPFYDRSNLIHATTETVQENLLVGMALVVVILLMFLSNVRSALIVAVNIPLALFFAFTILFLRGKSANLLSIGAVDFGIIVDSSVIMVENIFRHLSSGENRELPLQDRIIQACHEVERSLFFSTAIMVCAFLPLFTMKGPEGQIFAPMADTYAFALGGALLLALTIAPVLCFLFFRKLEPNDDNFLVSWLKTSYLRQLERCLRHRWLTLGLFTSVIVVTLVLIVPQMGREFMPELEEGNLWIRGIFPLNISLESTSQYVALARRIMRSYPEVEVIASQIGRPDSGTDPVGFYSAEFFVPLKPQKEWPAVKEMAGWRTFFRSRRPRTKLELVEEMNEELSRNLLGVDWDFSQQIRDNVMEVLSGVQGENSVKIIGPDLDALERLADQVKNRLIAVDGVKNVGVYHIQGASHLELGVDREKCKRLGVSVSDVNEVVNAIAGKPISQMIEGEKSFDISLRWPKAWIASEYDILRLPVDVSNNTYSNGPTANTDGTPTTGGVTTLSGTGASRAGPATSGSLFGGSNNPNISYSPRRALSQLISPIGAQGSADPKATMFVRSGPSTIYREQGQRMIAVKFSVRGRDLASTVAEAQEETRDLLEAPYRIEWSGEFQEMKEAEERLMFIIPLSLALIVLMLYLAFHSILDTIAILTNVVAMSLGGVWALYLTGTNFSISAAVGFISIFGVAIMDGLLLVSYFNQLRSRRMPLMEAIIEGSGKRVRPVMMTALTAIFGLLPAALSTRIGAQTQQPLAIVVVGGMIATLLVTRYLMPVLYSFYGHREPSAMAMQAMH